MVRVTIEVEGGGYDLKFEKEMGLQYAGSLTVTQQIDVASEEVVRMAKAAMTAKP